MELMGSATRLRRRYVVAGIEGKATRVGASEWSRWDASDIDGQVEPKYVGTLLSLSTKSQGMPHRQ
jgi:hypothetical protein